jgi:geranylgeranyl pyrophosphate synthase
VATSHHGVISLFAATLASMCEGQIAEASRGNRAHLRLTREAYYETTWGKTASLFILACQGGAMLAGLPEPQVEAVRLFGEKLGLAFQLIDDILDFDGDERELGKPVGSDLRQGTITLPIIYLRESLRDGAFERLFDEATTEQIVAEVRGSGVLDRSRAEAASLIDEALQALGQLPPSPPRAALAEVAGYVVGRDR